MSFRWYGPEDQITLEQIKHVSKIEGIVTTVYNIPVGQVWTQDKIHEVVTQVMDKGLELKVMENVPVHDHIKLGDVSKRFYIENYKQTIRNLSQSGIKVICFNFMPLFDWSPVYFHGFDQDESIHSFSYDEHILKVKMLIDGKWDKCGWKIKYSKHEITRLMKAYKQMKEGELLDNLMYFIEEIVPVAEQESVKLAFNPDDHLYSILGLPRVVPDMKTLEFILNQVDNPYLGLSLSTKSYGATLQKDIFSIIELAKHRIYYVQACNKLKAQSGIHTPPSQHLKENFINTLKILKKLKDVGFDGPITPEYRSIVFEESKNARYGLYDRALGATYLNGILDSLFERSV
ncbi:mannonate dehydratase [Longirhabdus pacifica]|uniref:mannonate dehydratase n=1 Tax=Longirhabdus pacifica TaxID=2305227 RepID=UPI001F0C80A0|nr:mannonate dehydratase [Longirhabdus pacifica]